MAAARPLTKQELKRLLIVARGSKNPTKAEAILQAGLSGLRANEIASITNRQVLTDNGVGIRETFALSAAQSKNKKTGHVWLTSSAREAMRIYLETSKKHTDPDRPFFESQMGGGYSANSMVQFINKLLTTASITTSSHSLRKTFASQLLRSGANLETIRQGLRHSTYNQVHLYCRGLHEDTASVINSVRF